jgi:hypothetical protein
VDGDRIWIAEELLREAVFRSRDRQTALHAMRPTATNCGLGGKAEVDLDLSPRGLELFRMLFAGGLDGSATERFSQAMTGWVEKQDAFDRKRNHFLKAFRGRHGFDRTAYAPEVVAEHDAGLAGIASEEDAERLRAAEAIAGA